MLEFLILGQLNYDPSADYALKARLNSMGLLGKQLGWESLRPVLQRLVKNGLITIPGEELSGDSESKFYVITPAGRQHFMDLMLTAEANSEDEQIPFHAKVLHFDILTVEQRIATVEAYQQHLEKALQIIEARLRSVKAHSVSRFHYQVEVSQYMKERLLLEQQWIESLLKQERDI